MILLSCYLLAQLVLTVWADDLSVPSSWDGFISKASREERINRTMEAIDGFIASDDLLKDSIQPPRKFSDDYWPYGELLVLIADFDIFTNQTRYKQIAQQRFLPALQRTTPNDNHYGYAAIRAYLAYRDEAFLDIAKDYWASNRSLTLSDADVQSKSSSAKSKINSTMSLACSKSDSEYTLAGATFHSTDPNDLLITTASTADYLTFTLSLATVPSNLDPAYMTLANQMGQFIRTALYKGSGLFYSNIPVGDPDCPPRRNEGGAAVSDAAVTMQSLSLLELSSENNYFTDVLRDIARNATGSGPSGWNSDNGVLDIQKFPATRRNNVQSSQQLLRSYFDLALGDGPSDLRTYLRAYLAIQASSPELCVVHALSDRKRGHQYDALVKQAAFTSGVPNLYGTGLRPESQLNPEAQTLAITALLGGVISSNVTSPNDPRTGGNVSDTGSRGRVPIGAIVGGVVGGVLALALAIAGSYYYLRRRRQLQSPPTIMDPYPGPMMASPMASPPITTSQPFQSREFVKRAPPISPSVTGSTVSSSIPTTSESGSSHMHEPTTTELVIMLNQRLRNEQWDANESPPEYHRSR